MLRILFQEDCHAENIKGFDEGFLIWRCRISRKVILEKLDASCAAVSTATLLGILMSLGSIWIWKLTLRSEENEEEWNLSAGWIKRS